ncbi:uncharacterized protein LOC134546248 isoform X2 [Bacillus rossius redtenbacheri]|uniref:uncharacterized protein LOC134546248 isoform X2 n=1 Tax=Bacillus rossius redtenbacheri TaxID=93214 RepID=UPI002FDE4D32
MAREWGHLDGVLTGASEALAVGFTLARHGFLLSRRRAVRRLLAALRRLEERCQGHPIVMRAAGQVRATTLAFNALALLLFGAWTSSPLVRARWLPQGAHAHIFRAACLGDDRYGASLALQALSFAYCFVAVNFDAGAAALMRLAAAQFRVLLASLASLKHLAAGDARVFRQLVACVDHHTAIVEFVRQLDSVYNSILLVQLLYSVLQIAIAGFQFTQISVDFGNSSKFMVAVAFLAVELYLFCSCGEDLMQLLLLHTSVPRRDPHRVTWVDGV